MKKNILIIYTDQLRRDVLGCYGGSEVGTPNIDYLAQQGMVLENFYTPSASVYTVQRLPDDRKIPSP